MDNGEKKELLKSVEKEFLRIIDETHYEEDDVNKCCNETETEFILKYGDILANKYPSVSLKDIYIVLVYTYYSLNLGEQTTDFLRLHDIYEYSDNFKKVEKLHLMITTSNKSIASAIRRHFFGMPPLLKNTSRSTSSAYRLSTATKKNSTARGVKKRLTKKKGKRKSKKKRSRHMK
jgi:hypothetical protein